MPEAPPPLTASDRPARSPAPARRRRIRARDAAVRRAQSAPELEGDVSVETTLDEALRSERQLMLERKAKERRNLLFSYLKEAPVFQNCGLYLVDKKSEPSSADTLDRLERAIRFVVRSLTGPQRDYLR